MASTTNTPQEQASTISAFAKELQDQISSTSTSSSPLAIPDDNLRTLDTHLTQLPLSRTALTISTRRQLDSRGTELWNTCMRVMVTCGESSVRGWLSKVGFLAFAMIESAAPRRGSGNVRALELALRTAKDCLGSEHLELGLKALETAAARLDRFEKSKVDRSTLSTVTTEYYILRIYLSWLQGRPDIAEHLFPKVPSTQGPLEQQKKIMEVCYIIGSSALSKAQPDMAVSWLERALKSSLCSDKETEQSGLALKDMGLLTLHALVRAHLQLNTASSRDQALQALDSLKTEYRDIFPVVMLQLDVFSKEEHPRYQEYSECLGTAVRMMEVTSGSLRIALYHIQKLRNWSWDLSMKASQQLLEKLVPSGNRVLIEQYFVAFIWMITNSNQCAARELDTIADMARALTQSGIGALTEEATHASLVLLWKRVENIISNGDLSTAEQWCQFVLEQPVFQDCSIVNRSVFQMKLMICALNNSNTSLSYEALERILEQSRDTPSILYLVYKITLLHDEPGLGTSALESLHRLGTTGITLLLSCAAEAQRLGKVQQVMDCIQRVIGILDGGCREELDFPTLVRSTIYIVSAELDDCKTDGTKLLELIGRTFEIALNKASKHERSSESNNIFLNDDIEWLFQKSYNLALQLIKTSRYTPAIRSLDISLKLAGLHQSTERKDELKVSQHYFSCDFLKVFILITEAREKTDPLEKKNYYTNLRNTVQNFRPHIANPPQSHGRQENYRTLFSFDFEAAIFLSQWDSLPSIIEESNEFTDAKLCAIFLDLILASEAPIAEMARVVMTIINILYISPSPTLDKSSFETSLPRYLRCLFQLSLQANEIPLAEAILDKAISLARGHDNDGHSDKSDQNDNITGTPNGKNKNYHYPNEELEWLATVAFNRAIDFYLVSADEECRRWAGKAIEVADLVVYNHGALGRLLRANLAKLS